MSGGLTAKMPLLSSGLTQEQLAKPQTSATENSTKLFPARAVMVLVSCSGKRQYPVVLNVRNISERGRHSVMTQTDCLSLPGSP